MAVEADLHPPARTLPPLHPLAVRITHWINAVAILGMISSGLRIYNASPIFDFTFPSWLTLGGWLGGALAWHFAIMWLLVLNGLVYLAYSLGTGHFRHHFLPISIRSVWKDVRDALTFRLTHQDGIYNATQRVLYFGVLALGVLIVLSGLAIWKPVQLQTLTAVFGGYETARVVHFVCMAGIVTFLVIHLVLVAVVPRTLISMITGRARPARTSEEIAP